MPIERELSPASSGAVAERNAAAQAMALRLAQTGSGRYLAEVETYQIVWNSTRMATREQAQIVGLSPQQAIQITPTLEVDGKFGPNTSGTLCTIMGNPCPPRRAAGMPVWVAQNQDRVAALVAPSGPPVEELIDPAPPEIVPPATNPQPDTSSGSMTVQVTVAEDTTSGPVVEPAPRPERTSLPVPVAPAVERVEVLDFADEPGLETPIITARPQSRVPVVAVLLGAAALGGTFWWFQYGRGRRRRRA